MDQIKVSYTEKNLPRNVRLSTLLKDAGLHISRSSGGFECQLDLGRWIHELRDPGHNKLDRSMEVYCKQVHKGTLKAPAEIQAILLQVDNLLDFNSLYQFPGINEFFWKVFSYILSLKIIIHFIVSDCLKFVSFGCDGLEEVHVLYHNSYFYALKQSDSNQIQKECDHSRKPSYGLDGNPSLGYKTKANIDPPAKFNTEKFNPINKFNRCSNQQMNSSYVFRRLSTELTGTLVGQKNEKFNPTPSDQNNLYYDEKFNDQNVIHEGNIKLTNSNYTQEQRRISKILDPVQYPNENSKKNGRNKLASKRREQIEPPKPVILKEDPSFLSAVKFISSYQRMYKLCVKPYLDSHYDSNDPDYQSVKFFKGKIKFYFENKKFGFISREGGTEIFMHKDNVVRSKIQPVELENCCRFFEILVRFKVMTYSSERQLKEKAYDIELLNFVPISQT